MQMSYLKIVPTIITGEQIIEKVEAYSINHFYISVWDGCSPG